MVFSSVNQLIFNHLYDQQDMIGFVAPGETLQDPREHGGHNFNERLLDMDRFLESISEKNSAAPGQHRVGSPSSTGPRTPNL
jgi:hypothetical protein